MRVSTKIKHKLRGEFPDAKFKVRKKSSSLTKSYTVYTDLIEEPDLERHRELERKLSTDGLKGEECKEWEKIQAEIDKNNEVEKKIKQLLSDYYHVDTDNRTGEILSGGNTYLNIDPWKLTKYL